MTFLLIASSDVKAWNRDLEAIEKRSEHNLMT